MVDKISLAHDLVKNFDDGWHVSADERGLVMELACFITNSWIDASQGDSKELARLCEDQKVPALGLIVSVVECAHAVGRGADPIRMLTNTVEEGAVFS